jgi:hypothetical protein
MVQKNIIFFVIRHDQVMAKPFAMISKYEEGLTLLQYKVRIWDPELMQWDWIDPIFESRVRAAAFIARYHAPEGDSGMRLAYQISMGTPFVGNVPRHNLRWQESPSSWVLGNDDLKSEYLTDLDTAEERKDACMDRQGIWEFIEGRGLYPELIENYVDASLDVAFSNQ